MKQGDIIRATRVADNKEPVETDWIEGERWALIKQDRDEHHDVEWLVNPPSGVPYVIEGLDTFEVVPEDQWPDEVCLALAKRVLIGEIK